MESLKEDQGEFSARSDMRGTPRRPDGDGTNRMLGTCRSRGVCLGFSPSFVSLSRRHWPPMTDWEVSFSLTTADATASYPVRNRKKPFDPKTYAYVCQLHGNAILFCMSVCLTGFFCPFRDGFSSPSSERGPGNQARANNLEGFVECHFCHFCHCRDEPLSLQAWFQHVGPCALCGQHPPHTRLTYSQD